MLKVKLVKTLPEFTLDIKLQLDNEILVILGPSGAGKTTFLQCIAGLVNPDGGNIQLREKNLFDSATFINCPARDRKVGFVFQDYRLFPHMTVWSNILYGCSGKKYAFADKGRDMLKMMGIDHLRERYPGQISGGEKQRVALARALMSEPQLMLMDEPLSALDPVNRSKLQNDLLKIHERLQIPFMLVTHSLKEANNLGDRVIHIHKGKIDYRQ